MRWVFFIGFDFLVITANACASLFGYLVSQLLHAMSRDERNMRLIKFDITVVAPWTHSFLSTIAWWNTQTLCLTHLPIYGSFWRSLDLSLRDRVRSWTNLAWVIDKPAHFADIPRGIIVILPSSIDNWCQKAGWDWRNWHFLQTWIASCCCCTARRNWINNSDWIYKAKTAPWTTPIWSLELW